MNKQMMSILDRLNSIPLEGTERLSFLMQSFLLIKLNESDDFVSLLTSNKIQSKFDELSAYYDKQGIFITPIENPMIGNFLLGLVDLYEADVINFKDMAEAISLELIRKDRASFIMPEELCKLGIAFLEGKDTSVYCPFESSDSFAERLAKHSDVSYETKNMERFLVADVRSKLLNCNYEKYCSDPISQPKVIESGGLKRFTSSIAFPPMGVKYPTSNELNDIWGRFPEKSFTGDVLHLRHMLAQTTDRVVAFVAASFLSRSTAGEKKFKQSLLKNNWLEAVISLPTNILSPFLGANISMIILDKKRTIEQVKFIDASSNFEKKTAREIKLVGIDEIVKLLDSDKSKGKVAVVTSQEIEANEYDLSVPRYVFSQEAQALQSELEKYELTNLEDVVELIRPQAVKSIEGGEHELVEINISSFNKIGEYNGIHKVIYQEDDPVNKSSRASKQFLQKNDVLIASKGSIGRIGLVEDLPAELTIAGQSFMIARVSPNTKGVTPVSLYQFLSSKLGNEQLQRIQSGATIPFINIKDLKSLKIPLATQEQLDLAEQLRAEVKAQHNKIEKLQDSLNQLTQDRWF
ncbi:N-6 DNA methylase [Leucothrix arctica]|uniref:site-specific DNA-methyltransferase (adenine-specific) n=1 Tax=Leucothrix arctica TaxID=1481894 RepID=A0A317C3E2_9GAMM|nr:N-6 DNA methylase [Leucothrix arctica]PWQ93098.1 hypothetical protein DKT75_20630 [Leucothrix arctica]